MSRSWIRIVVLGGVVALAFPCFADVVTTFDEGQLNPAIHLDVPNSGLAAIALDSANQELDFTTNGNTDLWVTRNAAPIAWTPRPGVGPGQTWSVETEVRFDTDVLSAKDRVAGITFYGGPDGAGGSSGGMDFTFGINNWDDRGADPGYQASIEVQGLADNAPGDLGSDLTVLWSQQSAFLRVQVTENGASNAYAFYYKANAADPWTLLGTLNSTVDNSRVALFLKNGSPTTAPDRSASFTYFNVVGPETVPTISPLGVLLLALALAGAGLALRR